MLVLIIFSALLVLGIFAFASRIWVNKPLRLIEEILDKNDTEKVHKLKWYSKEFKHISLLIENFFNKNEDLRVATEKAERANRLKTAFLTNMNHEIRTPMNGIIGFSEMLINDNLSPEIKNELTNSIRNSCNDLLYTINDILDISNIEAKEVKVVNLDFSINDLFHELSELFKYRIPSGKSHILLHFININNNSNCIIHSDKKLIRKILINLIDNAIKFTEKGHIEISYYTSNEDDLVFYVKDTGMGIPDNKLEFIFDRFRQGDESSTRNFRGNGLGLAISKGFVELLGGEIWVSSEVSNGTTFYFSIPDTPVKVEDKNSTPII